MMISENWGDFLLPFLRKIFDKHIERMKDYLPIMYNVENSTKAQEFTHGVGSMGKMRKWSETGGQVPYEEVYKGFKATYTHEKFANGLQIERELIQFAQYPEVKKRTKTLADSKYYTFQDHAAKPFNECLSFLGPDGVPLASTAHPLGPNNPTTWSNYGTNLTLSADNVEIVRNRMKTWTDDKGNKIMINPDTLIVPMALRKPALVIAGSEKEPDTTDNNVNIWKGAVKVIEWDFLEDDDMWFFVDMNRMKRFLTWFNARVPVIEKDSKDDFNTEVNQYKIVGLWSYGFDDASWVYVAKQ